MNAILEEFGKMDIYLLDQIMKGRINKQMRILDAGCGTGRNSYHFIRKGMDIWGIDERSEAIETLQQQLADWNPDISPSRFQVADLIDLPYETGYFDYIICNAVLHFAKNQIHFLQLFDELVRVLRPNGTLFIRMTSKHTVEHIAKAVGDGRYELPDGSTRYLLDLELLGRLLAKYHIRPLEPLKTTNVANLRSMTTLVLEKL